MTPVLSLPSFTGNRNNIDIFLYNWRALLLFPYLPCLYGSYAAMQDACQVSVLVYQLLFYSHTTFIQQKIAFVWNSGVNILHLHIEFVCIYTLRFYYIWLASLLWQHCPTLIGLLCVNILNWHCYNYSLLRQKNSFISYWFDQRNRPSTRTFQLTQSSSVIGGSAARISETRSNLSRFRLRRIPEIQTRDRSHTIDTIATIAHSECSIKVSFVT